MSIFSTVVCPTVFPDLEGHKQIWGHAKKFPTLCTRVCAPNFKTVSAPMVVSFRTGCFELFSLLLNTLCCVCIVNQRTKPNMMKQIMKRLFWCKTNNVIPMGENEYSLAETLA